jgi:Lipocalin-like domain
MYDIDGYMSAQIAGSEGAYGAFFGTYDVEERAGVIVHNIEGSSQAAQAGTKQIRRFRFSSDTLTLEGEGPEGRTITVWQKVRPRSVTYSSQ